MLAHGITNDAINEYCHLGENTTMEISKIFVWVIWELFELMYLKYPTQEYLECQLIQHGVGYGCLPFWTTYIIVGRITQLIGKANLLLYTVELV
jgi:hypothetical protein